MATEKRKPWFKFYSRDWRSNAKLRLCSFGARGLWADLLSLMHESASYGFLLVEGLVPTPKQLASLLGGSEAEVRKLLDELNSTKVYSVTGKAMPEDVLALVPKGMPKGVIFSRRMVRDEFKGRTNQENGNAGGNPDIPRGAVPKDQRGRGYKRTDAPNKTMRIFNQHDGHCHWCGDELIFHPDGSARGFHVDHVVAICDGGTNHESNLVPACADCNHQRVRLDAVGRARQQPHQFSDHNRSEASDHKAQRSEVRV